MCFSALVKRDLSYLESKFGAVPVRQDMYQDYDRKTRDNPDIYRPAAAQIFEKHWAPVIHAEGSKRLVSLMRFPAWPPQNDKMKNRRTHNARRDNLGSPFWGPMVRKNRGLLVIESFREWVPVAGLLKNNIVTLDDVKVQFQREREDYEKKAAAAGRKYRPSRTQLTDPRFRQIKIDFKPTPSFDMFVPVIFNLQEVGGEWLPAFAMITDEPIPFVEDAGHDRSPILLSEDAAIEWLEPVERSLDELDGILGKVVRPPLTYQVAVDEAA